MQKIQKNEGHQRGLASTVYKPFDNTSVGAKTCGGAVNSSNLLNQQLAEALPKKVKKCRVLSLIKDNIWGNDLADMQLI